MTANTEVVEESGVIRFLQATGQEQGAYICTATNEAGVTTATAVIKVQGEQGVASAGYSINHCQCLCQS